MLGDPVLSLQATCRRVKASAEITVPGYLAGWDLFNAALPAPLMGLGRRLIGDRRALTSIDHVARGDYETAIRRRTT